MNLDVLVVGDYCFDLILTGLPSEPVLGRENFADRLDMTIGGATFPTAVALRRLGLQVGIHMHLGTDTLSRIARETIEAAGFDVELLEMHDQPLRRLTVALSYPEDRAFLSYSDDPPKKPDSTRFSGEPLRFQPTRHVHFAHLSALLAAESMVDEARGLGLTISSDCGWNLKAMDDPRVWDRLGQIDIFMPNEEETLYLAGTDDIGRAFDFISERIPITATKRGVQGSTGVQGDRVVHVPTIPIHAVETTGAGDCYNAGFLFGYLNGWSLDRCLRSGNICGGLSTTAPGWEASPMKAELEAWLNREDT